MYSANALYFSLVIKAHIRAEPLSSLETTPTPFTKRTSAFIAVMTPLRSIGGACVVRGVDRTALEDEAAAARAMSWLTALEGAATAIPFTISRISVKSFMI
jgi:hypothetical protein